jgi:two-component system alkaline phosphatase synthesis response regulator PhoP
MKQHFLLAEDDENLGALLSTYLNSKGFQTKWVKNGEEAISYYHSFNNAIDFIILDVMMPILDGIETARQMKLIPELKSTIILFLTARGEEYTEIAAFEAGGTDYVVKPIKPRALVSRIKSMLNRESGGVEENAQDIIQIGDLIINRTQYSASFQGRLLVLPKKEFELLSFLARNPNKVFNRDELLEKVWGTDVYVVERTVDVHIRKLREKIPEYYIKTLKGVGYLFSIESI